MYHTCILHVLISKTLNHFKYVMCRYPFKTDYSYKLFEITNHVKLLKTSPYLIDLSSFYLYMVFISLEKIIIFGLWIVYLGLVQRNSIVFPQSLYVLYHINTFVWNHGWGFVSYKISLSSHYLSKYCTHISCHLNLLSLKYILVIISIMSLNHRKICYQIY